MKFKFVLPALTEAESPFWRPIKYSLFPPLMTPMLEAILSKVSKRSVKPGLEIAPEDAI